MGLFKKKTTENKLDTDLNISKSPKKKWKKWQKITLGVCGGFISLIIITAIFDNNGNNKNIDTKIAEVTTSTTTETTSTTSSTTTTQELETTTSVLPAPAPVEETTQQNTEPVRERYVPQTQATYDHLDAKEYTYVLNTKTHVFHNSGCRDVPRIKPKNYSTFTGTRDEAISHGYKPCGHCKP